MKGNSTNLEQMRQAVANEPDAVRPHLRLGTALVKAGFVTEGETHLRRAVELDRRSIEAWVNLGGALLTRWDFQGSIDANRKALEIKPDSVRALFNMGLGHLYMNQPKEMRECFSRVVELDPGNGGGHYYMAVALNALGEVESAQTALAVSIELGHNPEAGLIKDIERKIKEWKEKKSDGALPIIMEVGNPASDDKQH